MVPTSALLKALAVPWLLATLHKEPPAQDAPLFRGPLNTNVTPQPVLQHTLQGAIQHAKPPVTWVWVESKKGAGWH